MQRVEEPLVIGNASTMEIGKSIDFDSWWGVLRDSEGSITAVAVGCKQKKVEELLTGKRKAKTGNYNRFRRQKEMGG